MTVEFRLLGEVEVRVDEHLVPAGHARQRCVLAALLVDANRPVPIDQLVDRTWGGNVPQRARGALYTYLTRLRKALATATDVAIARRPGGYVLTVDPMAVDLHRFHHLLERVRATDDDEAAAALLEQALRLWRGDAFAALDTPWLNGVRDELDRERMGAELDHHDAELRLGHHAALLAALSVRAEARPLDERLAGQLLLALYRSGRPSEALERYRQIRRRLADEVGSDPSPPLQLLHQQILNADPALAGRPVATSARNAPAATTPRQLPAPVRHFTGRTAELTALTRLLAEFAGSGGTVPILAIDGTAGIGKTTLAVHWAHSVASGFPDGQLYVDLRGFDATGRTMTSAEAVHGFLEALAVPAERIPTDPAAQSALYRSLLADKRMLVLLDNAGASAQIRPLLPGAPGCLVLVTSRNRLSGLAVAEAAHPFTLDLLSPAEARGLLAARLGSARLAGEMDAVEAIIAACARLPLALAIVAARAAAHPRFPLAALAEDLRQTHSRLDALTGEDAASDVRAVFSWSYRQLTPDAARLFRLLGVHPGPSLSARAAASLAGLPPPAARSLLTELTHAHLITEYVPGRYVSHDLLRAYATEHVHQGGNDAERHAAGQRLLDHYLHTARAAALLLDPYRDPVTSPPAANGVTPEEPADSEQAAAWFTAEYSVLQNATQQAADTGFDLHAWQLPWALSGVFNRRGRWHDRAVALEVALQSAQRLADQPAQAYVHRGLARAQARLGRYEEALTHLHCALDLLQALDDQTGQAHTHLGLSWVLHRQEHQTEALDHALQALELFRAVGNRFGQARALNMVGIVHALLGDHHYALAECQQALTLHQQIGNRVGEAANWDSLGYIHQQLGHHEAAIPCYQHAVDILGQLGDRYYEAGALDRLATTHLAAKNPEAARTAWHRALAILDELDHPDAAQLRTKLQHEPTPLPPAQDTGDPPVPRPPQSAAQRQAHD